MYQPPKKNLEQFVREYGALDRNDIRNYSLALAAVEELPADEPLAAIAAAVVSTQDAFEEAWRKLGGLR